MALNIHKVEEALFSLEDCLTVSEVEALLKAQGFRVTRQALIGWTKRYPIGMKVAGRIYINPDKLALLLEGKLAPKVKPR